MFGIWTRRWLVALAIVVAALPNSPAAEDKKAPDPAEVKLRGILDLNLGFKTYLFEGETFPMCAFDPPARAQELLGTTTFKITWYNRDLQVVEKASSPGLYGAVVEVVPTDRKAFHRYFTLFRLAEKVPDDWRFQADMPDDLAKRAGLSTGIVSKWKRTIVEHVKSRPFAELSRDPRSARLLAGLSRCPEAGDVRKNVDPFAQDRQWWVGLKRKLSGLDKLYPKPFVGPKPIEGAPAPVVRLGSLAEAGMKPDADAKIDAVCRTWAADDDQAFAVCIVRHGVIVLHKAYGPRDGQPMTETTKSWMASITKSMSASLMMQMVDQELVSLDDPVDKYVPELREIKVETPLTIRHLYTHTNGLDKWPGWNDEIPDLEGRIALYYPSLKVGKVWAYNGTGYELGGKIIEAVSGEAVPIFFQNHLLDPLFCPNTDVIGTHADAFSVPLDIAKFGQMLLNRGAYGKLRFFREETFAKMLPQKLTSILGPDARSFGIGLDGNTQSFGHGAASAATFNIDRDNDTVVIMTRNRIGKNYDKYNGPFWHAIKDGIEKPGDKK